MRSASTSLDALSAEQAAVMLFDRGVTLFAVRDETGMCECLCRAVNGTGYRIRQLPHDFDGVRAALAQLWVDAERVARERQAAPGTVRPVEPANDPEILVVEAQIARRIAAER
ncbi:hypothetical protein D8770_26085 [Methylobacterium sp. DB1607]|nr:hypothetical protein [Methylobacterium sp. DB1607]